MTLGRHAPPDPPWQPDFHLAAPLRRAFAGLVPDSVGLSADWPTLDQINTLAAAANLRNSRGLPIRFAPQHVRLGQRDYETAILASGEVPTRPANWHDLFNALVWLALPHTKAALNGLHGDELGQAPPGERPPRSDAATLFDESGLLMLAPDPGLFDLLRQRRWHDAFLRRRQDWAMVRVYTVGHAVLEKALAPYPGVTAKCLALALPRGLSLPGADQPPPDWLDHLCAGCWAPSGVTRPADLFPLPILGIPGWWAANEDPAFYDQTHIFRPSPAKGARTPPAPQSTGNIG